MAGLKQDNDLGSSHTYGIFSHVKNRVGKNRRFWSKNSLNHTIPVVIWGLLPKILIVKPRFNLNSLR